PLARLALAERFRTVWSRRSFPPSPDRAQARPMSPARRWLVLALLGITSARADYLFTYFTKNGEDGLHLAASADGYHWDKLNDGKSYLAPRVGRSKLMRDPCVV